MTISSLGLHHSDGTLTISPDRLSLNDDELAFYKRNTGIEDDDKLKEHIIDVARRALEIYPYNCIRTFGFLRFRIRRSEASYKRLLEIGSSRQNALFLDLGCCFGNDLRKAIEDGYPAENVIASDLRAEFWKFGHDLFNTNPATFPVTFIPGDALDPSFISIQPPPQSQPETAIDSVRSILQTKPESLDFLRGYLSAIHTSAFFHLFNKDEQLIIAKKLASLLSPLPGSFIFGAHVGAFEAQEDVKSGTGTLFYRHSPETWKEMWEKEVFEGKGSVRVEAGLGGFEDESDARLMWWSVVRV
ncbi:hypothetical protein GYMLUDRAFT_96154 [Collybiopsis luxurians FD-317 M1]|uniref:Methyltransferase ausD n=1 Tax=Collybiopsis luxurians FD-317 M1 TaxID=944289 RepID=A0A0D0D0P6_9AGAR|nr:hypothetical protein GYMLUDRAFT_96154 [Collybiopsis luxurians FD-317 M1]